MTFSHIFPFVSPFFPPRRLSFSAAAEYSAYTPSETPAAYTPGYTPGAYAPTPGDYAATPLGGPATPAGGGATSGEAGGLAPGWQESGLFVRTPQGHEVCFGRCVDSALLRDSLGPIAMYSCNHHPLVFSSLSLSLLLLHARWHAFLPTHVLAYTGCHPFRQAGRWHLHRRCGRAGAGVARRRSAARASREAGPRTCPAGRVPRQHGRTAQYRGQHQRGRGPGAMAHSLTPLLGIAHLPAASTTTCHRPYDAATFNRLTVLRLTFCMSLPLFLQLLELEHLKILNLSVLAKYQAQY